MNKELKIKLASSISPPQGVSSDYLGGGSQAEASGKTLLDRSRLRLPKSLCGHSTPQQADGVFWSLPIKNSEKEKRRLTFNVPRFTKKGFTIIFAVIIGSLLVAIGVAITNLALKQLAISAVSRESQVAFYAADGGIECALYWDIQGPYLNSPFYFASPSHTLTSGTMSCGSSNLECLNDAGVSVACPFTKAVNDVSGNLDYYENRFIVHYGAVSPCALVTVRKYNDIKNTNIVDSSGINDCSNTDNKYRVERSLRAEYK